MPQSIREYLQAQRKAGKTPYFTNIPEGAPEDAFVYDEPEFTAETERLLETPGGGMEYTESLRQRGEIAPSPIPKKPPDEILTTEGRADFKNRQKYSQFIVGKMGFDPHTFDPDKEVEKAQKALPGVFEAAFGGKALWRDRDKLNKEEKAHWDAVHKAFNVHVKNRAKARVERGKEEYKLRMKVFEDKVKEKKAMPAAMEKSLESIFISVNEEGKKIGKIPGGVLSKANRDAEKLVNTEGMTGPEATAKVVDDIARERIRILTIDEALNAIPDMVKGLLGKVKNIEDAKSAAQDAMEQGAEQKEVKSILKERGWDDKAIKEILPKEEQPPTPAPTPETIPGAGRYRTPEEIRNAFRAGTITRDQAKQLIYQITARQ